ncbi:MAG TPA: hypothetical protein VIS96_00770 [Terrimicrobiaceae bacterium]
MKIPRRRVSKQFKGRIKRFGRPNRCDGQDNPTPVGSIEMKIKARKDNENCGQCMDPGIVLRAEQMKNPSKGVFEAPYAAGEFKGTVHRSGNRAVEI